jgi:hypothetical protein
MRVLDHGWRNSLLVGAAALAILGACGEDGDAEQSDPADFDSSAFASEAEALCTQYAEEIAGAPDGKAEHAVTQKFNDDFSTLQRETDPTLSGASEEQSGAIQRFNETANELEAAYIGRAFPEQAQGAETAERITQAQTELAEAAQAAGFNCELPPISR